MGDKVRVMKKNPRLCRRPVRKCAETAASFLPIFDRTISSSLEEQEEEEKEVEEEGQGQVEEEEMNEENEEEEVDLVISNVFAVFDLKCPLNLSDLATRALNVELHAHRGVSPLVRSRMLGNFPFLFFPFF